MKKVIFKGVIVVILILSFSLFYSNYALANEADTESNNTKPTENVEE